MASKTNGLGNRRAQSGTERPVVRDQNRFGPAEENCAEQDLQRSDAIAHQPSGFSLRSCEDHYVSFAPSIEESRVVRDQAMPSLQPKGAWLLSKYLFVE